MNANPAYLVLGALFQLLFLLVISAWGRWVARRNGNRPFWRVVSYLPFVSVALIALGTIVGVVLLTRAFETIGADPASKATRLAEGISSAMNASAMFLLPGYALLLFAFVSFAIGTLRAPTQ